MIARVTTARVPLPTVLSPDLESRLRDELGPAEQIVWSSQPLPNAFRGEMIGLIIFALFWNGITWAVTTGFILSRLHATKNGPPLFAFLFLLLFVVIGLALVVAVFRSPGKYKRTAYAITDRRAMIITLTRRGGSTVESFRPESLTSMIRKQNADGSGDLIFEQFRERRGSGTTTIRRGFIGIRDVKLVEDLITRTLLSDRVRAV